MSDGGQPEPGGRAGRDGNLSGDLARSDPLVRLVRRLPKVVWYGLAALALVGTGVLIGRARPATGGPPLVEQGTVTWVSEGLAPTGGPAVFVARLDGQTTTQPFVLANFVQWTNGGTSGWQVPGSAPPIPACLVPAAHNRRSRDGFGPVHAHIKFGVVRVPMPDGAQEEIAAWVMCE